MQLNCVNLRFIENFINITDPKAIDKALEKITIEFHFNPKTNKNENGILTFLYNLHYNKDVL